MKKWTLVVAMIISACFPVWAQRSRRAPQKEDTGPVDVTRSATFRIPITIDPPSLFDYLTDAQKLEKWFPDEAVFEPQLLGKYHFRWNDREGVWSGIVTEFIRGNTLGFTWKAPDEELETNVKIRLSVQPGGSTLLDLTHSGFTSDEAMDKAIKDWVFYLSNLKSVVEGGPDLRIEARKKAPSRKPRAPVRKKH